MTESIGSSFVRAQMMNVSSVVWCCECAKGGVFTGPYEEKTEAVGEYRLHYTHCLRLAAISLVK